MNLNAKPFDGLLLTEQNKSFQKYHFAEIFFFFEDIGVLAVNCTV